MRKKLAYLLLASALLLPLAAGDFTAKAQALNQKAFVFDAHCDTVMRILEKGVDLGVRSDEGHIDIPRMKAGGLNAQVFALDRALWEKGGPSRGRSLTLAEQARDAYSRMEQKKKELSEVEEWLKKRKGPGK